MVRDLKCCTEQILKMVTISRNVTLIISGLDCNLLTPRRVITPLRGNVRLFERYTKQAMSKCTRFVVSNCWSVGIWSGGKHQNLDYQSESSRFCTSLMGNNLNYSQLLTTFGLPEVAFIFRYGECALMKNSNENNAIWFLITELVGHILNLPLITLEFLCSFRNVLLIYCPLIKCSLWGLLNLGNDQICSRFEGTRFNPNGNGDRVLD